MSYMYIHIIDILPYSYIILIDPFYGAKNIVLYVNSILRVRLMKKIHRRGKHFLCCLQDYIPGDNTNVKLRKVQFRIFSGGLKIT